MSAIANTFFFKLWKTNQLVILNGYTDLKTKIKIWCELTSC